MPAKKQTKQPKKIQNVEIKVKITAQSMLNKIHFIKKKGMHSPWHRFDKLLQCHIYSMSRQTTSISD